METTQIYARATDEMKRQAQRKIGEKEDSVFKDDVAFKYADNLQSKPIVAANILKIGIKKISA